MSRPRSLPTVKIVMGLFSVDRLVVIFPEEAKVGAGLEAWGSGRRPSSSQGKLPGHTPETSCLNSESGLPWLTV